MSIETRPTSTITADTVTGALFGLAVGDAWGDPVEFRKYAAIRRQHGNRGPDFPYQRARITDDTQMSLAVWDAITDAVDPDGDFHRVTLGTAFGEHFAAWSMDPDNNRAPGNTCMGATRNFREGDAWDRAGIYSRGCGSVMRAPWIGLHPHVDPESIAAIADLSAIVTHTEPGAVSAANAAAVLAYRLATGQVVPGECAEWLMDYATTEGPEGWAESSVIRRVAAVAKKDPEVYTAEGWELIQDAAEKAHELALALGESTWGGTDPCLIAGEGWDAITCLAVAVGILDGLADRPTDIIRRAAFTNGDSDSIAAVTGALAGAAFGTAIVSHAQMQSLEPRYFDALSDRVMHAENTGIPTPVFTDR